MITTQTTTRIAVSVQLSDMSIKLRELRSYICFNDKDVEKIDNIIMEIDEIVNKVMGVK